MSRFIKFALFASNQNITMSGPRLNDSHVLWKLYKHSKDTHDGDDICSWTNIERGSGRTAWSLPGSPRRGQATPKVPPSNTERRVYLHKILMAKIGLHERGGLRTPSPTPALHILTFLYNKHLHSPWATSAASRRGEWTRNQLCLYICIYTGCFTTLGHNCRR